MPRGAAPFPRSPRPCEIIDDTSYEKDERFLVILSEPTGGAVFRDDTDGRDEQDICTVTIEGNGEVRTKIDRVMELLNTDRQRMGMHGSSWKQRSDSRSRTDTTVSCILLRR